MLCESVGSVWRPGSPATVAAVGTPVEGMATDLLAYLGDVVGSPDLAYRQRPRRLAPGMVAEVWALSLADVADYWAGPLILRLYPADADPAAVQIEAAVQSGLASQDFPAPRVIVAESRTDVLGRRFMIMQRVPGRPAVRGTRPARFVQALPGLVATWPVRLAAVAASLHGCAIDPIATEAERRGLSLTLLGWDRHLRQLDDRPALESLPGWVEGLGWLHAQLPLAPAKPVVVHGDLWPANVLYERRTLSGIVDWERAALGEPELDVGFAKVGWALMPAPAVVPPPIHQALHIMGQTMAGRIENEYARLAPIAEDRVRYYEALRCALELASVVDRPPSHSPAEAHNGWQHGARALARHFKMLTGIQLERRLT